MLPCCVLPYRHRHARAARWCAGVYTLYTRCSRVETSDVHTRTLYVRPPTQNVCTCVRQREVSIGGSPCLASCKQEREREREIPTGTYLYSRGYLLVISLSLSLSLISSCVRAGMQVRTTHDSVSSSQTVARDRLTPALTSCCSCRSSYRACTSDEDCAGT